MQAPRPVTASSEPWLTSQNPTYTRCCSVLRPEPRQLPVSSGECSTARTRIRPGPDAVERGRRTRALRGGPVELGYQATAFTSTPTFVPMNTGGHDGADDRGRASNRETEPVPRRRRPLARERRPYAVRPDPARPRPPVGPVRPGELGLHPRAPQLRHRYDRGDWDGSVNPSSAPTWCRTSRTTTPLPASSSGNLHPPTYDGQGKILGGWSLTANGYWSFNKGERIGRI